MSRPTPPTNHGPPSIGGEAPTRRGLVSFYERLWTALAGVACAVGLVSAVEARGAAALSVGAVIGLMGVMCVLPRLADEDPWVIPLLKVFAWSWLGGSVLVGLGVTFGVVGLGVTLVLALMSPALLGATPLSRIRRGRARRPIRRRQPRTDPPPVADPAPSMVPSLLGEDTTPLVVPDEMTIADLCHAWRSSYVALQRATSAESRLRTVTIRALYLAELERRAEPAVRAWLESGARAASDPGRYLDPQRRGSRTVFLRLAAAPW